MSTATLETTAALPLGLAPGRSGRRAARPRPAHLQLVPTSARGSDAAAGETAAPASAWTVAAPAVSRAAAARRAAAAPLRITRRGRLALTSTATLVVALVLLSLMGVIGPAGASSSVVVQPGMTLSQIASQQLPGVPLSQAVTDIQRANKLSTTSIAAGQELVIPGR
ncbi:LysM peptidoglycan-binding domain-containing protein [Ornithinimicrobium sufpigmenti]|uniref:LysM peptidoglycan-binding domain-containing protein n=1 Tax=Ornithinimicrobium sufpigmenti TaxID=2508882 RepID=UPI0010355A5A|nr:MULTISPECIES: LysM peptidoglycan-binding domain-containing protein [unclassified Ornithinimicrobium]